MSDAPDVTRPRARAQEAVTIACALAMVTGFAIRLILLVQPIGGDPGIYAYIGDRILAGEIPYRDLFEQKPPGVLYTYAAGFWLFGRSMVAVQVMDLVAWTSLVALVPAVAWSLWRDRTVAAVAAALAALFINPSLQSSFKQVGQTETFLAVWAMAAMWLVMIGGRTARRTGAGAASGSESAPRGRALMAAAGMCCGVAFTYKYNAVTYLVACVVIVWLEGRGRRTARDLFHLGCGFLAPVGVMVLYFLARGGFGDLIDATVLYNVGYTIGSYDSPAPFLARAAVVTYRFLTMNLLWFAGGIGLLVVLGRAWRGDGSGLPIVFVAAASYVAILVNAKFYPQYFLQILPVLSVAGAFGLVSAVRGLRPGWMAAPPGLVLVALLWVGVRHVPLQRLGGDLGAAARYAAGTLSRDEYHLRFGGYNDGGDFSLVADEQLATLLRETTTPDQTTFLYGGEPLVLFLAHRRSPSRFIWNDPFLAGGFRGRYTTRDLIGELERGRPAYVIVIRNDQNLVDPIDSLTHFREDSQLRDYVMGKYREVGRLEDFFLFRRKDL